jgi:hypothetical protein
MVQNQDDLPLALQKDNILALAVRGNKFRELLLQKVNGILQKCTVQQDMFTGNLKIDFPISMLDEPERALQHVVPAWARIHHTGKAFKFDFQGLGTDKVSPEVIDQLRDTNCSQFNIQSVSFKKIKPIQLHRGLLFVTPETPRRTAANPAHLPLDLQPIDSHGELRFRVVVEGHNSRKETMTILVHNDRAYYIRSLDNADFPVINKRVASHLKKYWNIGIHRAKGYPIARFSVLCHMEGQEEVIDALPHFRIDLSPDVKTFCNGNYNLSRRDEWREVKWIEEKESR